MATTEQLTLPGFGPPTKLVYFGGRNGFIKIGSSTKPPRRAKELGIRILRTEPGGLEREHQIHLRFRHARIDREWFMPTPDLLEYITRGEDPWGQLPEAA